MTNCETTKLVFDDEADLAHSLREEYDKLVIREVYKSVYGRYPDFDLLHAIRVKVPKHIMKVVHRQAHD